MIAMGTKIAKGIENRALCNSAVAYLKDVAFKVAADEVVLPKLTQKQYLDKEVFNMRIDMSSGVSKLKRSNDEKMDLLRADAAEGKIQALRKLGSM